MEQISRQEKQSLMMLLPAYEEYVDSPKNLPEYHTNLPRIPHESPTNLPTISHESPHDLPTISP